VSNETAIYVILSRAESLCFLFTFISIYSVKIRNGNINRLATI